MDVVTREVDVRSRASVGTLVNITRPLVGRNEM
jgi:hypothetical protein